MFLSQDMHRDYVVAGANLRAEVYGLKGTRNWEEISAMLEKVQVPKFSPISGVKIAVTDTEAQAAAQHIPGS